MADTPIKLDPAGTGNNQFYNSPIIPTTSMTPATPMQFPTPTPVDTAGLLAIPQGIGNAIANDVTNLTAQTAAQQKKTDESGQGSIDIMTQLLGKTADTQIANEQAGVNAESANLNKYAQQLADLNAQASSLNREAQAIPLQTQENNRNTGATDAGVAPQNAGALRLNALKALSIGQQSDIAAAAATGSNLRLQAAKDKAQQIVDLKYKPLEDALAIKEKQYELNKDTLMSIDKKRTEALTIALDKEKTALADKKQTEQNNVSNANNYAKAAIDAGQPELAGKISTLDPASTTFKTDLAKLTATIKPDQSRALDSALKQAQIAEIAQKISDAKKSNDMSGILGSVSPVAQLPDGTYDSATQEAILAKMSPADAALVEAVGNYTMDIAKVTSLRSDQRQILAAKVALVYPGFDMTNYATHAAYRKSLAGTSQGTTGGAINSANKVINHLTDFVSNVSKLGNGWFTSINTLDNTFGGKFNQNFQESLATSKTDATGVKDELAKFFKGSGVADVHTIDDWSKTVNVNGSPAQVKGSVQGAINLLQGQLVPMIDQYKQTMGQEPPDGLFLKTDTIGKLSTLKNQGFKIDIPGVNYTDKSAWMKYGGGTQAKWNEAVDALTQAGLPITQENILQATQY